MKVSTILVCLFLMFGVLFGQAQAKSEKYFNKASITVEKENTSKKYFKFVEEARPAVNQFIAEYRSTFSLSDENELRISRRDIDELGQTHYRYKQYYKGLEVFDTQFLVHEVNGTVKSANGEIINRLDIETAPGLSEGDALKVALTDIGASKYMWQSPKEEEMLKKVTDDKSSTYYPKGELGIAAERGLLKSEHFKLVYRFDVYAAEPMSRHYVDVDARTGKVINKISRIHTGTVAGSGESLYNGNVKMKVANQNYPEAPSPTYFHVESGAWVMSDPDIGGYADSWYQVLDSDPIALTGSSPELSFNHSFAVEDPSPFGPYDGWDGINVRVSTDAGASWQVLANPVPAYTNSSLYSFGDRHGEGTGIPGWTGSSATTPVTVDLSAYAGQTVQIRFAFASDEAYSTADNPSLFGWEIDDILVTSSDGTLFSNDGSESGMTPDNLVTEVNIIAGDYRLRETIRGDGVFTYDLQNSGFYSDAVDFVSDSKNNWPNDTGISVHWATEETYDYFKTTHNRDSFDDNGGRLISYARALTGYNNAFWNGSFMTYGDGDGTNFGPLVSLDVVGHELTHGVTERSAGLIYQGESGALNESFSDIFGNAVEFFVEGDDAAIWGVGEDFDLSNSGGFRSMSDPNSKGDPDTYYGNFWQGTTDIDFDNGGVHFNSGVQNYWFYLLVEGGSGTNDNGDDYDIKGIGLAKAAKIAYRNLTIYLTPYSAYYAARVGSIEAAEDLYGRNSKTVQAVKDAWDAVGVYENQPFLNLDNLKSFVQGLGLAAPDETYMVGLLDAASTALSVWDVAALVSALDDFQSASISLYYGAQISWTEVWYLLDETDKVYEMYSLNPSPTNNRPKPQVQTIGLMPQEFALEQNYPNPFNPVTNISFSLPEASDVKLTVYNSMGQMVKTVAQGSYQPGSYSVSWNGTNDAGTKVANGVYVYKITAGSFVKVNKMLLLE